MFPSSVDAYLRPAYRVLRRQFDRASRIVDRRTMTPEQLRALLVRLEVSEGAVVMLHSSMDAIDRRIPCLSPSALIQLLQDILTPNGTLLMPTFPFIGSQARYASRARAFDVRRTPSQSGLLTEVFRRTPGVMRSLHPTHPIAGWGRYARELTGSHHLGSAFGPNSPWAVLADRDGIVVGLGTGLRDSFTNLHVPEEIHPKLCARFLEPGLRTITIEDGERRIPYTFRALRADVPRNYDRVERILVSEGILRKVAVNGLHCTQTRARRFIARSMMLVDAGRYL